MGAADRLIGALLREQDPEGWFLSRVGGFGPERLDRNGFATARVLRELAGIDEPRLNEPRERALDCLERCASTEVAGAFRFWPEGRTPGWFPGELPPDLDDSAVVWVELVRHGRRPPGELRRAAVRLCIPARARRIEPPGPPWIVPGAFRTWLGSQPSDPVVDATVNANVAALLATAGLAALPGYEEACRTIRRGVEWAGDNAARGGSLSPYYASAGELKAAVRHAVSRGAGQLVATLRLLEGRRWARVRPGPDQVLFRMAYGSRGWAVPALHHARRLRHLIGRPTGPRSATWTQEPGSSSQRTDPSPSAS